MEDQTMSDADRLWNRLGLQELRESLKKIGKLANRFEQALRDLPSCDKCATLALLDQIKKTGNELSGETASLTALSETLRQTISVTEKIHNELMADAPVPCRCSQEECKCHG